MISPDTKQVLLHKNFREISHCAGGQEEKEYFGFICRDVGNNQSQSQYIGYIFKCDNTSVVEDILQGLKSAFHNAHQQRQQERNDQRCDRCPIEWYNKLAGEVDGVTVNKAQGIILKSLEKLESKEKENILSKMEGAETTDIAEQNQVLMLLLKASCEQSQESHQHSGATVVDTDTDNTNLNMMDAVRSAKRSLAESFNGIMRRRASTDNILEHQQRPVTTVTRAQPVPGVVLTSPSPVKTRPAAHPLSVSNAERMLMTSQQVSPNNKMEPLTPSKHAQVTDQSQLSFFVN